MFVAMSTQWRMAPMGGMIGLDYGAIPPVLTLLAVPRRAWADVFADLRVMEAEALQEVRRRG